MQFFQIQNTQTCTLHIHPTPPQQNPSLQSSPSSLRSSPTMASIPTTTFSSSSLPTTHSFSPPHNHQSRTLSLPLTSFLFGTKLTLQRHPSSTPSLPNSVKCRATSATVSFSLPTTPKPQSGAPEKTPKWSARAIKSYALAELEARKLRYPNMGTEALLMGILVEGTSKAAKFLRASGITFFKVREETLELLGKSDLHYSSPVNPPLTEPAQKALDWAINEKLKSGEEGEINVTHLLLGIWSREGSAGRSILSALGFNEEKAKELAKTIDSGDIDWNSKKQA